MRILVIDDVPDVTDSLVDVLDGLGYEACGALSGSQAFPLLQNFIPDVVICDLAMSGQSGLSVCAALRGDPRLQHAIWVAYSGHGSTEVREQAWDAGYDLFFLKPTSPLTIVAAIERLVRRGPLRC